MLAPAIQGPQFTFGYFVLNIDPILVQFHSLAIHWYGLAYVVAICVGLIAILRYTRRLGLFEDQVWGLFLWTAIGGLVGGRLYFVVQQPDLVQNYLLKPINIISVWNGGMAFFGAIFVGGATLFFLAPRYGVDRFIALDGGALFAAVGQIFGRFGNIINGDILGYAVTHGPITVPANVCAHAFCVSYVSDPHILPWAFVYLNPHSFAPLSIPFQPAPVYEMLLNLVALAILWPLRLRLPRFRAGLFFVLYAALYAITQFTVFFARGSEPLTPFLGVDVLKQAQWTAVFVFLLALPSFVLVYRFSRPWPYSEANPVPFSPTSTSILSRQRPSPQKNPAQLGSNDAPSHDNQDDGSPSNLHPAGTAPHTQADGSEQQNMHAWQPTRPVGGGLRNIFSSSPAWSSSERQRD